MRLSQAALDLAGKHILVTGGTGFIGVPLCRQLVALGARVSVLTRDAGWARLLLGTEVECVEDLATLEEADIFALVNLAGAGIMDKRWTRSRKQLLLQSRLQTTHKVLDWCRARGGFPPVVISGSAIGYYGDTDDVPADENTGPGEGFAPRLCCDWELVAGDFARAGSRLCLLRTGVVLGPDGGALASMLPVFKYGLGGRLGSGEQWVSWIHREDLLRVIIWLLVDGGLCGPVNATAPTPVRNRDFTRALAQALKRPALLPVPALVLKVLLGQAAEELLLASNRVIPAKALRAGFSFHYTDIDTALEACVKKV